MSVDAATNKIKTPQTSKWIGSPRKSKFGWRVSKTTTSRGTKKMRRVVRLLGRFMKFPDDRFDARWADFDGPVHYKPGIRASQRYDLRRTNEITRRKSGNGARGKSLC